MKADHLRFFAGDLKAEMLDIKGSRLLGVGRLNENVCAEGVCHGGLPRFSKGIKVIWMLPHSRRQYQPRFFPPVRKPERLGPDFHPTDEDLSVGTPDLEKPPE
jgi:hypothetical protein